MKKESTIMRPKFFFFSILFLAVFCLSANADYIHGIDVSKWQGTINWSAVASADKDFAFIKATQGVDYTDHKFHTNIVGAHSVGILAGAYHFATPYTGGVMDAAAEASDFVTAINPYLTDGYLRPVLDMESGNSLGKTVLSNWINTFMSTVESLTGIEPLIYCNSYYANNFFDSSIAQYDLWIARWTYDTSIPPTSSTCGVWDDWSFWQYSNSGSVSGISGAVDLDVFKGNINDFIIPEPASIALLTLGMVLLRKQRK